MSKAEILLELPKLKLKDRREIWLRLGEMDGFDEESVETDVLTEEERESLKRQIDAHKRDPRSSISWEEMKRRLNRRRR